MRSSKLTWIFFLVRYLSLDLNGAHFDALTTSYTSIEKSTIDSLYTINNNKRFNIHFDSETLIIKRIRANINNEAQEMVYNNLYDSIKGMNDEEKRNTILKLLERQPKDDF
ncbi:hypothetical protein [Cellulophaga baltica]|uniref:hypothetical protein n=1 Tax=Cellulophaga baltica TaxID=76594 RepID=UPI0024959A4F|nr:hypothetical protein [Cellulophaga baltica]